MATCLGSTLHTSLGHVAYPLHLTLPAVTCGRYGDMPGELRHPSGVAVSNDLLLVSEWNGGRVQALSMTGVCLQSIREPFTGACVGAIAADDSGHATVTDSDDRLHCLHLSRRGEAPLSAPALDETLEPGGPLVLEAARNPSVEQAAHIAELKRTRVGRIQLALNASDYRGVIESLTADDMAALVPQAYAYMDAHPEKMVLPPVRSADQLAAELEAHLEGRGGPIGPPH